jgi:NADH:ubiquinone oxidoreductase subunit 3 (subunit A)
MGSNRGLYDLRFFRIVLLFVLYDLELLYLLP